MDQTQTPRYVSRFEPLLYVPAFTQKDFHYVPQRASTKGPPSRNYNDTNKKYTTLALYTSIQEVVTKSSTKQRKITT